MHAARSGISFIWLALDALDHPRSDNQMASALCRRRRMASPSSSSLAACSNMLPTKAAFILVLLSTTVISTVVGQDCTTITDWQSLRTTIISLKKSQKTLVLCPFDVDHPGIAEEDGIDLYKKGLTLVCHGQTGSVGGDTMYRGSPADIGPIPVGCTIKGKARHFNILADDIALVGLTFSHSQSGAISVGSSVMGTAVSNCHFHNNINIRGDGGAIILGPRSAGTVLIGNEFSNNGAWGGGAVSGVGSELEVRDCLFRGNRANMGVVRTCTVCCVKDFVFASSVISFICLNLFYNCIVHRSFDFDF